MSGMGASLLPVPPMPPKKGLVGKVKSDPKKLRMGGGKVWEDTSLDDWDPSEWVWEGGGSLCLHSNSLWYR